MEEAGSEEHDPPAASRRTVDVAVAVLLGAAGALVMWDSVRIGFRWAADGPEAGYFPFYVGLLLTLSSLWSLVAALAKRSPRAFVGRRALRAIVAMLLPTIVYVVLVAWLGLYVASFLYIAFFMIWLGHYSWGRSLAVGAGVSVLAFLLFDVWFKVPLPKGPLEALLGLA